MSKISKRSKFLLATLAIIAVSCGNGKDSTGDFPRDFNSRSDKEKVAYMMEAVTPDSVARFICDATLGDIPGVRIDTMAMAVAYVYEAYKDDVDVINQFGGELDSYAKSLPLDKRMQLLKISGETDSMGLGYQLGLEYVGKIRNNSMTTEDIDNELKSFKKACGTDMDTYRRFVQGFKVALREDAGKDFPQAVYNKYINMSED
jgi:hypothetical protein